MYLLIQHICTGRGPTECILLWETCEQKGLNHQCINFIVAKQLWQYQIFSLFSLFTAQCTKKCLMLATTLAKIQNYKLCGTQRSRCCRGSTLMTEIIKRN